MPNNFMRFNFTTWRFENSEEGIEGAFYQIGSGILIGNLVDRPSAAVADRLFIALDENETVYKDDGTSWIEIGNVHTQNTDTILDEGGTNEISAAEITAHTDNTTTAHGIGGKEDSLGNPDMDGKVLSSTAAGVRSWITPGGGTDYTFSTGLTETEGTVTVDYGTGAGTACEGNDGRLSDARPASDVSAWAKASTKPAYNHSELGSIGVDDHHDRSHAIDGASDHASMLASRIIGRDGTAGAPKQLTAAEVRGVINVEDGSVAAGATGDAHAGTAHAPSDANNYTHPDTHDVAMITGLSDAATTTVSTIRSGTTKTDVSLSNVDNVKQAPNTHVGATGAAHGAVTTSVNGFMTSDDKTKLNGIATSANNYTHPGTIQCSANNYVHPTGDPVCNAAPNANNYVHPGSGTNPHGTTKADVGLSGIPNTNASTVNYLRGDGTWVTPPNTNTWRPMGTGSTQVFRADYANTAYSERRQWNGGSSNLNASTGRTSLGLGNHVTHNYGTAASTVCQGNDARLMEIDGNGDLMPPA